MAYIYKITNTINEKVYIGETTRPVNRRWNEHVYEATTSGHGHNYHLHNAMNKYGVENFNMEILEICSDEERFERESYYISLYNSIEPNGYNYLLNGRGSVKIPLDLIMKEWENNKTINEIASTFDVHKSTISNQLKANGITEEEIQKRAKRSSQLKESMPVLQYDLNGNFIKEWESASSVKKEGYSQSMVSLVCRQEQLTAHGYLWKYKVDKRPISEWVDRNKNRKSSGKPKKPIYQLDENHIIIKEFESASAAAQSLGLKDKSNICAAARKGRKAYGYYWQYKT